MAKKPRSPEQATSRTRKTPVKRTTPTASKAENARDDQATRQSAQETVAKPVSSTNSVKKSTPPTARKRRGPADPPAETQQKQTKPHKTAPETDTASVAAPARPDSNALIAKTEPSSSPGATAKTAPDTAALASPPAEQTPPIEATPTEPKPVAAIDQPSTEQTEPTIAEVAAPVADLEESDAEQTEVQTEPVTENETPSMEEILAAAQPVQEPIDEEPSYIPPPLTNKYLNKEALRDRLWLSKDYKPIISYVGRLDFQKGVNLIRHGIFYALEHGAQFVLLGTSPEHKINEEFWQLKHQLNDSPDCHLEIGFNEELSHLIYAGSDMMIMPSLYEPCGLAQMIALKYGTVPIVRWVGGLADTVFDKDHSHKPLHERNGYVFSEADAQGLESAMYRAIGCWYSYPDDFRQLIINGMRYDYSWNYPGQHYLNIYEHIRSK